MAREVRFNYAGSRVLVTGGSNGIGLAIAEAYASSGAEVSITGTARRISDYPHDLSGFKYHSLDMRDGTAVDEVVSGVGELDVLVNCAGNVIWGPRTHTQRL